MGAMLDKFDDYIKRNYHKYEGMDIIYRQIFVKDTAKPYKKDKKFMEQYEEIIAKKRDELELKKKTLRYFHALLIDAGILDFGITKFGEDNLSQHFDSWLKNDALLDAIVKMEEEGCSLSASAILEHVENLDFITLIAIPHAIRSCQVAIEEIENRRNPAPPDGDDEHHLDDDGEEYGEW